MLPRFHYFSAKPIGLGLTTICMAGACWNATAQPELFGGDPSSSSFTLIPNETDDWTRHFRLGAMVALNISAKFGLSANYNFGVNGNNPSQGIFDDGYVRPDQSGIPNYTSNFGYNSGSQYNAAANTLTFHSISSYTLDNSGQSSADGGFMPGLDLAYGGNIWYWKHARVGWELGFGLLPIDINDNQSYKITANENAYVFNVPAGVYLPNGPYNSDSSGLGPHIPLTYASTSSNPPESGTLSGSRSLDVMFYTIRLGPTFYWDISEKFAAYFGAGPAVGLADGELKYNDTISLNNGGITSHSNGSFSSTDFTYGGYVNATVLYHWNDNADLYIGAQYMPMGNVDFNGNGRQAQLDLGGQLYISAGIHWPF